MSASIQGGKNVERFQPQGSCVTYVRTLCHLVMKIPDRIDFAEAATLPSSILVAYRLFNLPSWPHKADLHEPILILGADTTYGLCAVQLAHAMEYRVIAVGEQSRQKLVEQYGADVFIGVGLKLFSLSKGAVSSPEAEAHSFPFFRSTAKLQRARADDPRRDPRQAQVHSRHYVHGQCMSSSSRPVVASGLETVC